MKYIIYALLIFLSFNNYSFANDYESDEHLLARKIISAAGDDPKIEKPFEDCVKKISEIDWRHGYEICCSVEEERLKKIMNRTYSNIIKSGIDHNDKLRIENAQRTWLSFKKQFCDLHEHFLVAYGVLGMQTMLGIEIELLRTQAVLLKNLNEFVQEYIEYSK